MTPNISVIIITKNEAENIRACLESVAWADEIIVVDSGSQDGTLDICRELTPHVFEHDWPGFGPQKNRALGYAACDWVLSLDADERVTPELHAEILQTLQNGDKDGYYMPRLSQFCGQFIHHSGWYPDYVLRLFKKSHGRFSDDLVHESVILEGRTGHLKNPLLHYTYRDRNDVERKIAHYAEAAALQMFQRGKTSSPAGAFLHAAWAFIRTYFIRLGFLDGAAGFNIARMNARTTHLKYKRLEEMRAA